MASGGTALIRRRVDGEAGRADGTRRRGGIAGGAPMRERCCGRVGRRLPTTPTNVHHGTVRFLLFPIKPAGAAHPSDAEIEGRDESQGAARYKAIRR